MEVGQLVFVFVDMGHLRQGPKVLAVIEECKLTSSNNTLTRKLSSKLVQVGVMQCIHKRSQHVLVTTSVLA